MSETQLPSHWQVVKLGSVFKFTQKPRGLRYSDFEQVPFVPMELIPNDKLFFTQFISKGHQELTSGTYFEPGDFLLSKITPSFENGKQGIIELLPTPFGIATTEVIPIKELVNVSNKEFLAYYLLRQSIRFELAQKMEGSTGRQRLSKSILEKLEIPFPPLTEQRALAHTLRTIQKAKEARQRELELERERKAALMQYLFTYGTCHESTKQTEIGEIPESWQVVKLGELCLNKLGIIQTGPFGSQLHASDYQPAGIPVVNPTHLGFNFIVDNNIPYISREKADSISKHYLIEGDILISRRGDFSRYSYVKKKYAGWFCGTGCLLIRLNNPQVDNYFLSILISTAFSQNYLKQNSVGSIMPNLNTQILQALPLILPEITEQREIANIIHACDRKIQALEKEISTIDELFRAMLSELMNGRLSTQPLIEQEN